jgi:AcrR family transcriptional regulator
MSPRNEEQNQQIRDERREQILLAALKVFARRGLAATKISDIVSEAGLSHGLVYHYFDSKDAIFTALLELALKTSSGIFKDAYEAPGTPWERLKIMTEMILPRAFQGIGPLYFFIVIQAVTSDIAPQAVKNLLVQYGSAYEYLFLLIQEGQKAGQVVEDDPLQLTAAYCALIQGLAVNQMQGPNILPLPNAEMILRLLKK